ncbi:amidohydrolase [Maribacter sp.]|nr:amidohydrolase [Maribacter sp.]
MSYRILFTYVFLLLFLAGCTKETPQADLIILNTDIWTGNSKQPRATAMAIAGDTILAIGSADEMNGFKNDSTQVIDAAGRFVVPGFIDAHVHLLMGGNALLSVKLRDANTKKEFMKRIANYSGTLTPGAWLLEGNWDHTLWGGELPQKEWIDEFTSENPMVIYRLDGHMVLANSMALSIAGINESTADIAGGEIVRNANGSLTGILKGSAMTKMLNAIPPMTASQKKIALRAAGDYLLSNGVTSVHDVDSLGTYAAAKELYDAGELAVRIYSAKPLNRYTEVITTNETFERAPEKKLNNWLKTGLVKGFVDGSLGSHTAAFKADYSDRKGDAGFFITKEEDLYAWISAADKKDLQVTVHAIGDKAISTLLDIYERISNENGKKDRRLRMEHAQHIDPNDIARFAQLGVIASVQPYHAIDDGRWAEELIGADRIKTTYAFKSLLDTGATLAFGSDWPVAPASPLMGIYAATTRRTVDDKNPEGWVPKQKITAEQGVLAYTKNAAFASFDEDEKGTLEVGKLADFVILSADVTKMDGAEIKEVEVLQTYVGGIKRFDRKEK